MRRTIWLGLIVMLAGCSGPGHCGGMPPRTSPECRAQNALPILLVAPFALPVAIVDNISSQP